MSAINVIPRTLGLLAVFALAAASARGDDPPARPAFDPEEVFNRADMDGDGKMSKQEFQFVAANAPRLRDDPQRADRVFGMLDADRDGSLSPAEFRRLAAMRGGGPPGRPPRRRRGAGEGPREGRRQAADRGSGRVLREEGPPGPRPAVLRMSLGPGEEGQGRFAAGHPGRDPPRRRAGAGCRPRRPRGQPAGPGGPVQGREPPDAAEAPAAGRGGGRPGAVGAVRRGRPAGRQGRRPQRRRHREGPAVLGVPAAQGGYPSDGAGRGVAAVGRRPVPAGGDGGQGGAAGGRRRPGRAAPAAQLRPDRAAADAGRGRGVPGRRVARRGGEGGRPAAGVAGVRRAVGPALARRRPVRRVERQAGEPQLPARLAVPRLRRRQLQRRQAVQPVRDGAGRRRPDAGRGRPAAGRAGGRHGVPGHRPEVAQRAVPAPVRAGPGRRADRRDHAGVPRAHRGLRPVPRPQVRPHPAARLLRAGRHLPQHRDAATAPPW